MRYVLCSKLCTPTWLAFFGWGHRPRAGGKAQKRIFLLRIPSTPKTLAPHPPETLPFLFPYRWGGPLTSTHLTPHPLSPALPAICRLSCSSHHSLDPAPPLYYPDFLLTMPPALTAMPSPSHHPLQTAPALPQPLPAVHPTSALG